LHKIVLQKLLFLTEAIVNEDSRMGDSLKSQLFEAAANGHLGKVMDLIDDKKVDINVENNIQNVGTDLDVSTIYNEMSFTCSSKSGQLCFMPRSRVMYQWSITC
jgi:hypothetical protein